jgi:alkylation response protein AidB-like acyl-CoA dehydrogenase
LQVRQENTGATLSCIACAAGFCSSAIRRIRRFAEDAFLTAIVIAQQQKARSFELRTALDLARLYRSTSRCADAHALLASALKGFSTNSSTLRPACQV